MIRNEAHTLIKNAGKFKQGDWVLFQEYIYTRTPDKAFYQITKPKLVLFMSFFIADQTIGMDYVPWVHQDKVYRYKDQAEFSTHVDWDDYINVLGHWATRPGWRDIRAAYKKAQPLGIIP